MARYKPYSYDEVKHVEFRFQELLQPNTIEYTIHQVVDHAIDLSIFESRYRNDRGGAPAYAPERNRGPKIGVKIGVKYHISRYCIIIYTLIQANNSLQADAVTPRRWSPPLKLGRAVG
jgi:hypothetical protein